MVQNYDSKLWTPSISWRISHPLLVRQLLPQWEERRACRLRLKSEGAIQRITEPQLSSPSLPAAAPHCLSFNCCPSSRASFPPVSDYRAGKQLLWSSCREEQWLAQERLHRTSYRRAPLNSDSLLFTATCRHHELAPGQGMNLTFQGIMWRRGISRYVSFLWDLPGR